MSRPTRDRIGFTCAYTPLPVIAAAGFTPYRVLPMSAAPDQAGRFLHDNICPHVKRIIDRAMDNDLPPLRGMVVVNSCDAMRRLVDAWQRIRPQEPVVMLDLPATRDAGAVAFYATELERLAEVLEAWGGQAFDAARTRAAVDQYNRLGGLLQALAEKRRRGRLAGGSAGMQAYYNQASTRPSGESMAALEKELVNEAGGDGQDGVPV
ncbi:MAG: 2-hydroxyacyl-CoA dehydratase, partial [Desulfosarcina sp.]|nr:2-hydroxyacyl-CoA dehydratase [Desulfobacterales bacterium]